MKGYKTDNDRLASHFKTQRDNWKERALTRQKEKRALEAKVEYTAISRDKWKNKAIAAQEREKILEKLLKEKEAEIKELKKKIYPTTSLMNGPRM